MSTPQYPLENFFEQLAEILKRIEQLKATPSAELPEDLKDNRKYLELLNYYVQLLDRANQDTFKKLGIKDEDIEKVINNPPESLPPRAERLLKRTEEYKQQLEAMRKEISTKATIAQQREEHKKKPDKLTKERKKKFRGVGGKKNWKPL